MVRLLFTLFFAYLVASVFQLYVIITNTSLSLEAFPASFLDITLPTKVLDALILCLIEYSLHDMPGLMNMYFPSLPLACNQQCLSQIVLHLMIPLYSNLFFLVQTIMQDLHHHFCHPTQHPCRVYHVLSIYYHL